MNAYNQPGVDKHAAARVVDLQRRVVEHLGGLVASATAEEIAHGIGEPNSVETIYKLLKRMARQPERGVVEEGAHGRFKERFQVGPAARA